MEKLKSIAVCLPTYNEADMIELTTKQVDAALMRYSGAYNTYIVNCDSNSSDNTCEIFKRIETKSKSTCIRAFTKGKGTNILNFLEYCVHNDIDFAITLDVDVRSMDEKWIDLFLEEMIVKKGDYIVPSYQRSKFEGSTTNHFAFPLIYALTGKYIRQPIGGDFAFNKNFIQYIYSQPKNKAIEQYGIDIFLTLNAVYGCFDIHMVYLGRKIHKPSFPKMYAMFREVLEAAIFTISFKNETMFRSGSDKIEVFANLISNNHFVYKKEALELQESSYNSIKNKKTIYGVLHEKEIGNDKWISVFYEFICLLRERREFSEEEIKDFVDLFSIRAVTYWIECEKLSANEAECIIVNVAETLRKYME